MQIRTGCDGYAGEAIRLDHVVRGRVEVSADRTRRHQREGIVPKAVFVIDEAVPPQPIAIWGIVEPTGAPSRDALGRLIGSHSRVARALVK